MQSLSEKYIFHTQKIMSVILKLLDAADNMNISDAFYVL